MTQIKPYQSPDKVQKMSNTDSPKTGCEPMCSRKRGSSCILEDTHHVAHIELNARLGSCIFNNTLQIFWFFYS
jgi:hypothetical protein